MANTLGTKERMILTSALSALHEVLAPVQAFSYNTFNEENGSAAGRIGETVLVKTASSRTAANFDTTNGYEVSGDQTFTDTTVTLNVHKVCAFHMTDLEATQHRFNMIEAAAMEAAQAVGLAIFQNFTDVFVDGGSYANTTVAIGSWDSDDVIDMRKRLNDSNVPLTRRSILATPESAAALLKDNAMQDASASGTTEPLREGVIGRLGGFDVYETTGLSTTVTAGSSNVHTIGVHPEALAVALRTVPPSDDEIATAAGLRYGEMMDDRTGITLGMRSWYNTATGKRWGAFEILGGKTALRTAAADLVKSA